MRVRAAIRSLAIVLSLGIMACGDSPTESGNSLVATWDVRSVDGQTLPYTETEDLGGGMICSITISAMHITFTAAGRYTVNPSGSFSCPGVGTLPFTDPAGGTYRVSGNTLFMTQDPDEEGPYDEERNTFSISGRTLTIVDDEGTTIVLHRR